MKRMLKAFACWIGVHDWHNAGCIKVDHTFAKLPSDELVQLCPNCYRVRLLMELERLKKRDHQTRATARLDGSDDDEEPIKHGLGGFVPATALQRDGTLLALLHSEPILTVRIIPPNLVFPHDYRFERLNVHVDKDGNFKELTRG